jgi:hypothetical protein
MGIPALHSNIYYNRYDMPTLTKDRKFLQLLLWHFLVTDHIIKLHRAAEAAPDEEFQEWYRNLDLVNEELREFAKDKQPEEMLSSFASSNKEFCLLILSFVLVIYAYYF